MVPQGQLPYYTPTAPHPCQTPPFQFPQHPHVQSAPPVSLESHPIHPVAFVDGPASVSLSCTQPGSDHHHHGNFAHFAGSKHTSSASLLNEGTMPCTWQEQSSTRACSPPPPAYPPGFEPKHDTSTCTTMNAATRFTTVSNAHLHPQPYSQPRAQAQPQPQPQSYNPCSQPQPYFHSHSHPHPHPDAHPHPEPHAYLEFQLQHQHEVLQMQPSNLHPHQQQSSQMAYHAPQMACQTPMQHPTPQASYSPMFQNCDESGAVLGVPVMGTPVYLDAKNLEIPHYQQPYPRQQSSKSIYHLTKYFQRSVSNYENPIEEGRQQCGQQPSTRQNNRAVFGRKYSRANMGRAFVPSVSKPRFLKPDWKQLAPTHSNGHEMHYSQKRYLCHKSNACVDEKPKHCQVESTEDFCIPDTYCEDFEERSDRCSLKFNAHEMSSLASACSEAQLTSLVKCQQEGLSSEMPGETAMESELTSADSKTLAQKFAKNKAGVTRWLEQRKNKYPTPANMQRKAEERRKQVEMGEYINKKPRNYLRYVQGACSVNSYRREIRRIDKQTNSQEQYIGESEISKTDGKGLTNNHGNSPDHCANDFEMPMEIEDSGPIESPYQGQMFEFEKCIQEENSQSTSKNGEVTEKIDKEKIRAPCFAFAFRRKRRVQKRDQSALVAQQQKRWLFQLLNGDLEKENSHLLQCCRYIVNNHFFQGLHHMNPAHFTWIRAEKPSHVDSSHVEEMNKAEILTFTNVSGPSANNHPRGNNQDSPNQVLVLAGADGCRNVSTSNLNYDKKSCIVINPIQGLTGSAIMPARQMGCSNKEQEPIEEGHGPTISAEKVLVQEAYCSSGVVAARALNLSRQNKEQSEEASVSTIPREESNGGCTEQDPLEDMASTKSGNQFCHEIEVGEVSEVHSEPAMTSHNQSAMDGFVDSVDSSFLEEPSCIRYEKDVIFPWKHSDSCHLKNIYGGLAPAQYDFKVPLITSSVDTDTKQAAMLSSNSILDSQGPGSSLWDQANAGLYVPGHDIETSDLGTGYSDSFVGDDDDILQYMNFDAFDADPGVCYS